MEDLAQVIAERISDWPDEAVAELLRAIDNIEIKYSLLYRLTDDERAAIREGLAQAERGEFASNEDVAALFKRFRS